MTAIEKNNLEAVKLFLTHGADVNQGVRSFPLLLATMDGDAQMVELLLSYGANKSVPSGLIKRWIDAQGKEQTQPYETPIQIMMRENQGEKSTKLCASSLSFFKKTGQAQSLTAYKCPRQAILKDEKEDNKKGDVSCSSCTTPQKEIIASFGLK